MNKKEYLAPAVETVEMDSMTCVMTSAGAGLGDLGETTVISDSVNDPMDMFTGFTNMLTF